MNRQKNKIKRKYRLTPLLYTLFVATAICMGVCSCKGSKESLTRRLFMQSKRVNLELPPDRVDSLGNAVLSENVSYQHEDNTSQVIIKEDSIKNAKRSINEMQYLHEVTVTARLKQKFAPERDGRVNVDFVIRVPRELLSADYRMQLFPKLLHNDSIVPLGALTLKGTNFLAKQEADSLAYDDYIASIIGKDRYDELFLDRKGIAKDMEKRQESYWNVYNKQQQKVKSYYKWKNDLQDRYDHYNLKMEGRRSNLYHKYMRDARYQGTELLIAGVDTTGINSKYTRKYEKRARLLPQYHLFREIKEKNVPKKYRDFYLNEPDLSAIDNHTTTEKDSVEIARDRYFFDRIAENEFRDKNRDEVKNRMIPFLFETGMRLDSVVTAERDFVYYYTQDYPVTPGLKSIRIAMDGKVIAIDRSSYTLAKSDTLSYVISSLVQLADTSLIIRETKLYRNMYDKMTIYPQFEPNKSDFKVAYSNEGYSNRQVVDTLMSRYRKLTVEMGLQMDSLEITSWASLDGSYDTNYELSRKKAESLAEYLQSTYPQDIGYNTIKVIPKGEDWQGLVDEIRKRNDIANTDSILAKISRTTFPDQTEQEIRWQYKKDYRIIKDDIYPRIRRMDISFHISRPGMMATDSIRQEVKEGYQEGLRLLMDRQYWEAIEILKDYPDYNTALCLACMGYNGRAYDLLTKLRPTGNTEYLLAIVTQRMGKEDDAVTHLLKAVELDDKKAYRWRLDSEVIALVNKYNLKGQIETIANQMDYMEMQEEEQQEQQNPEQGQEESAAGQQQAEETTTENTPEESTTAGEQTAAENEASENNEM